MRRLFLLRHGEAGDGWPDSERELTAKGRSEVLDNLDLMADRIGIPIQLIHSGLVRARQTAELAAERLNFTEDLDCWPEIDPAGDPESVCKRIEREGLDAALLVTHNPFVERLLFYLTQREERIKTGSLAAVSFEVAHRGCAELDWLQP